MMAFSESIVVCETSSCLEVLVLGEVAIQETFPVWPCDRMCKLEVEKHGARRRLSGSRSFCLAGPSQSSVDDVGGRYLEGIES
jgi:hypothetical protein